MKIPLLLMFLAVPCLQAQQGVAVSRAAGEIYSPTEFVSLHNAKIFSYTSLNNHFKIYKAHVNAVNSLYNKLARMDAAAQAGEPEYAALNRRFSREYNGMRLHEAYFSALGGAGVPDAGSQLHRKLTEQYGTFAAWRRNFAALGSNGGIGWAALVADKAGGRLFNIWIDDHDLGIPAEVRLILVMDVFEHAYLTDFHLDKARYIETFLSKVKWEEASRRYEAR